MASAPTELAPVQTDKHYHSTMSKTANNFRDSILKFKRYIYDSLETDEKGNHDIERLDDATNRVIHLGNILGLLIRGNYDPLNYDKDTNTSIQSVKRLFEDGGVEFDTMDDSTQRECSQVLEYDIYWFPYSLSKVHTKSLVDTRK
jgi:hypothetical protein